MRIGYQAIRVGLNILLATAGSALLSFATSLRAGELSASGYKAGFETMEHPELLPCWWPDGTQTRQISAYNVTGENDDWHGWTRYTNVAGEIVFFDTYGPGCLYRQHFNVWHTLGDSWRTHSFKEVRVRFYFDDEEKPRVDLLADEFFGKAQKYTNSLTPPLVYYNNQPVTYDKSVDNFAVSYYPFPFAKRLRITLANAPVKDPSFPCGDWFQFTYLKLPGATNLQSWTGFSEDSPVVRNQWERCGADPKDPAGNVAIVKTCAIPNGGSATVLDLTGEGSIASLKFTLDSWSEAVFTGTTVKIYWDKSDSPAVDQSLGSFFGGGGGAGIGAKVFGKELKTLFFGFSSSSKSFYAYWPMPFWSRARIVIENRSGQDIAAFGVEAQYKKAETLRYPKGTAGYFHAKRTIERNSQSHYSTAFEDFGKGSVVGLNMYNNKYAMDGDEFTYIDDAETPAIHGNGSEDDHNQGYSGCSQQKPLWGGLFDGVDGAYRIYYNDAYRYERHIGILYEHSACGGGPTGQDTDFTVWYYKDIPGNGISGNLWPTDQLDVGDPASESGHSYVVSNQTQLIRTSSAYDGMEFNIGQKPVTDSGRYHKGFSQFMVAINPANNGVLLRRRLNRSGDNVQKASVCVDNKLVTEAPWYFCDLDAPANQAFADTDFVIPAAYTRNKRKITIKIVCESASDTAHGINEYYYWVYSYGRNRFRPAFDNAGFERGTFTNWSTTGTAFGAAPTSTPESPGFSANWQGTGWASSRTAGEAATGSLKSAVFTLGVRVSFLSCGWSGSYSIRKASDNARLYAVELDRQSSAKFSRVVIDTSANQGSRVYFEVVDNDASGSYAWLALDDLRVSYDNPGASVQTNIRKASDHSILYSWRSPQATSPARVEADTSANRGVPVYFEAVDNNASPDHAWLGLDDLQVSDDKAEAAQKQVK